MLLLCKSCITALLNPCQITSCCIDSRSAITRCLAGGIARCAGCIPCRAGCISRHILKHFEAV
jgi:hypothetical protein